MNGEQRTKVRMQVAPELFHALSGSHAGGARTVSCVVRFACKWPQNCFMRCQVRMQVAPELFQGSAMNAVKDINIKEGVSTING